MAICFFFCRNILAEENWPQFRGPHWDGHSNAVGLPLHWSEKQNVAWKAPIPGEGWSSPVIWGGKIWMTSALDHGKSLHAIEVDQTSGKILADVEVFHVQHPQKKDPFNSYASPTPVLEEGRAYVCFGTNGSACLDTATAKPIWVNTELNIDHINGPGSSPIVFENLFLLCCDGGDFQYLAALDKNTGKIVWKTNRSFDHSRMNPDLRKAYNTPIVVRENGVDEVISVGAHRFYCYDVHTGKEIWYCDQPGFSSVSQPIVDDGVAYFATGFPKSDLIAVRTGGHGDVTKTNVLWRYKRGAAGRSTPLLIGEPGHRRIFMVTDNGMGHYLDAKTGNHLWTKRLGSGYSASPLFAEGLIWCFDEDGTTVVLRPGVEKLETLATNTLDDGIMGTPAISGKAFYIRTKKNLYRIEESK